MNDDINHTACILGLVPCAVKPMLCWFYTDEADRNRRIASIIRWEYRMARQRGTLISDPDRWHVSAREMVSAGV